ncbi:hypothetical protein [Paraconexibacter sp.]|uniref:hypothetical protein n=1 Tax=Paraconexibacter sp. TaxID=2949640 RepID=UPI0035643E4D
MKIKTRVNAASLAVLATSVAAIGAAHAAGLTLSPDKQAVVDSATEVSGPVVDPSRSYKRLSGSTARGAATEVNDLKQRVVSLLERDRDLMRPSAVSPTLKTDLSKIYGVAVLEDVVAETTAAIETAAADPSFPQYSDHEFQVDKWEEVLISTPVTADITVTARERWLDQASGQWTTDPPLQYQLTLVKELDQWKLLDEAAFDPAEAPAIDGAESPPTGEVRMP